MTQDLISSLPDGPLDIVGDVHGEIDALRDLMRHLGYAPDGTHAEKRKLVFVGDLCDRGPDSPGVFTLVMGMVKAGRACCLLGNHELNLLRKSRKEGNGWFFAENHDHAKGKFLNSRKLDEQDRDGLMQFLQSLPLALERSDLRTVHACWHAPGVEIARKSQGMDTIALYEFSETRVKKELAEADFAEAADAERSQYHSRAEDENQPMPLLPNYARHDEVYQNGNPVRALSSGIEQVAAKPFYSTGKWRLLDRARWWTQYEDDVPVVFGHYWRAPAGMEFPQHKGDQDLFKEFSYTQWLGPRRNAMCVDYCIGMRYSERAKGKKPFGSKLGALRWPERILVTDDGDSVLTR